MSFQQKYKGKNRYQFQPRYIKIWRWLKYRPYYEVWGWVIALLYLCNIEKRKIPEDLSYNAAKWQVAGYIITMKRNLAYYRMGDYWSTEEAIEQLREKYL